MIANIRTGATHRLTGTAPGRGGCDHCDARLTHRIVITDAAGAEMIVGRKCASRFTGWTPTLAEAEAAQFVTNREITQHNWIFFSVAARTLAARAAHEAACRAALQKAAQARSTYEIAPIRIPAFAEAALLDAVTHLTLNTWIYADADPHARQALAQVAAAAGDGSCPADNETPDEYAARVLATASR
ncbi:hypothetical protein [Parafrankia discariae]|uniref:hypothetical protein n=1 Tax=Parafrankia discariae TaxID=365528 RepID=UPI0003600D38|nr:hypothetical protein [Parafrankia discariae]